MDNNEKNQPAETVEAAPLDPNAKVEIIGVRFREGGKVYYFAPNGVKVESGDRVIVETSRGTEYGFVATGNSIVPAAKIVPPLRPALRAATKQDDERYEANKKLEEEAFEICRKKIADHGLDMKLIEAEYTFDNSKLLFYFSAEVRVDFRELVKDLASVFRTRIELRQIGIRDEAKMLGGLGVCGRPFCCSSFLSDFVQVSIKMAKEQNLSLNSSKISGTCGRLMCCLRYEHETYEAELARTPPMDSTVKTVDGVGVVTEVSPLTGFIKVKIDDNVKAYHRDDVKLLHTKNQKPKDENVPTAENEEAPKSLRKDAPRRRNRSRGDGNGNKPRSDKPKEPKESKE